jgi:uncharacterized protein
MTKLGRALKAGIKGFSGTFGLGRYQAAGIEVVCPHCHGKMFEPREAQLNTSGATMVGLDWLNQSGTALMCERCGLLQWFGKKPERL